MNQEKLVLVGRVSTMDLFYVREVRRKRRPIPDLYFVDSLIRLVFDVRPIVKDLKRNWDKDSNTAEIGV